ncbi:MAG TPA: hypothetical protein VHV51_01145 [Polyangiaceae bacterium]|jgi:hypothetical protein|nr:hypothetical protein [Polyangiaceae bacterium]
MTEEHLTALLNAAEAKKDDKGWVSAADGRLFTLYIAYSGAGLTVSRIEAVRIEGKLLHARTNRGELYLLALGDVYAGALEGPAATSRKAGFT